MTVYLDLDEFLVLAEITLGCPPDIRDVGLLQSALSRPAASAFGADAYTDLSAKAAALLQSLACNHALVDGNKRCAWVATRTFIRLNRADVIIGQDEAYQLVMDVATGQLRDIAKIAEVVAQNLT
ncbi:MAG: type II toxin-antitoxin system death-on-curing family toxin [Actinobacteria bacterium]|nr:type II toxin-antitoxin system death-on-curing family toxin [Actinomycetota bacterium]